MKRLFIFILIAISINIHLFSQKQLYIVTDVTYTCEFDINVGKLKNCQNERLNPSTFIIDVEYEDNSFIHITESMTSKYDIISYHEDYVDLSSIFSCDVISESNNKYRYVFDLKNKIIFALFLNEDQNNGIIYKAVLFNVVNYHVR
jgi:hypothetical protein